MAHPAERIAVTLGSDRERTRLTVALRPLIVIPLAIWLDIWGVAAALAVIANWFATLATGRSPQVLHDFLGRYIRYAVRVGAYHAMLTDPFPGFTNVDGYPAETAVPPPGKQGRISVLLRLIFALPALVLNLVLGIALAVIAVVAWIVCLVTGRMPETLENWGRYCVRYHAEAAGYLYLVTDRYPAAHDPDGLTVRGEITKLSRHVPGPTDRVTMRVKYKVIVDIIVLVGGGIVLGLLGGFGVSAFIVWVIFAALYTPPWERVPVFGKWVRPGAVLLLALLYPFYWDHTFTIPVLGVWPDVPTGVYMLIFMMMAVGLNIVVGYAGLLDLGYVAFYAMGAYTAAWFASVQFANHNIHFGAVGVASNVPGIHVSIWLLLPLAGIVTAFVGVAIGLPTLRLRGDYLAIVTLGFGEIMPQIARNGDNLFGTGYNLTNGPNGITPIDSPGFFHLNYLTGYGHFLFFNVDSARLFYWTAILLLLITIFCSVRLRDSRLGRAWVAIREDETAAAAMGVPLMRTKTWAYATGAFFGGVAGAYYASFKSATFPGDFFFNISVFILCMVILGGMGNVTGVLAGAAFLSYLDREGLANTGSWLNTHAHVNFTVPKYEFGIFGVILVVTMLFRPEGLIPSTRRKAELHEGVRDESLYDIEHGAMVSETVHGYDEKDRDQE